MMAEKMQCERERKIRFMQPQDVQEFVHAASGCDFDINMHYDRAIVDAKSFLGILSLGLSKVVTVKYCGQNDEFENILSKYAAA